MKIILLKDVSKLGQKFDVKDVKSGHALNLLIPRGDAIPATREAMKRLLAQKAQAEGERKVHEDLIAKNIADIDGITVRIIGKANEKGHLFAGIHKPEIVVALKDQTELMIDPSFVQLEHPIKVVGEHMIQVKSGNKSAKFKLIIEATN